MTSPNNHEVTYTARANFRELMLEAAKAEASLRKLEKGTGDLAATSKKADLDITESLKKRGATAKSISDLALQRVQANIAAYKSESQAAQNSVQAQAGLTSSLIKNVQAQVDALAAQRRAAETAAQQARRRDEAEEDRKQRAREREEASSLASSRRISEAKERERLRQETAERTAAIRAQDLAARVEAQKEREARSAERRESQRQERELAQREKNAKKMAKALADLRAEPIRRRAESQDETARFSESTAKRLAANSLALSKVRHEVTQLDKTVIGLNQRMYEGETAGNRLSATFRLGAITGVREFSKLKEASGETVKFFDRIGIAFKRAVNQTASGGGGGGGNFARNLADGFDEFGGAALRATKNLATLPYRLHLVRSAAGAAITAMVGLGASGAVAATLGAVGSVAFTAAGALQGLAGVAATLPGIFFAAAGGIAALITAVIPVVGTIKEYMKVQEAAGTTARSSGDRQKRAAEAIADASRAVANAQRDERRAKEELIKEQGKENEVRREALRTLEDLRAAVERNAQDELEARAALERSNENYTQSQADAQEGANKEAEAITKVAQAETRLAAARANKLAVDANSASSDHQRTQATLRLNLAQADLRDAQEEAGDAAREHKNLNSEVTESLLKRGRAQLDLKDTLRQSKRDTEDLQIAERKGIENSDQLVAYRERLEDAERRVSDAQERTANAIRQLSEAQSRAAEATDVGTAAQDRFKQKMDELTPSQRKVVEGLIAMKDEFKAIVDRSGEGFFRPLVGRLGDIKSLLPEVSNFLGKSADALGRVTAEGIKMISSGPWKRDFRTIAKSNAELIETFGGAALKVVDAFRNIGIVALPYAEKLADAIEDGARKFRDWSSQARADGSLGDFFDDAWGKAQLLWRSIVNISATFASFVKATSDFSDVMLGKLEKLTGRWREIAKAQEAAGSPLKKYLEDIQPLLTEVAGLLGDIGRAFAESASDPKNIEQAVELFQLIRNDLLPSILRFLHELNESGLDKTFVSAIADLFNIFSNFLGSGVGGALTGFVNVLAGFLHVIEAISRNQVAGAVIGSIATALGVLAAASLIGKFTGLFKIRDFISFLVTNKGQIPTAILEKMIGKGPSQVALDSFERFTSNYRSISEGKFVSPTHLAAVSKNIDAIGTSSKVTVGHLAGLAGVAIPLDTAAGAAERTGGRFANAMGGIRGAASKVVSGLGSVAGFLLGPWGAALAVGGIALTALFDLFDDSEAEAKRREVIEQFEQIGGAAKQLGPALKEAAGGSGEMLKDLFANNPKLKEFADFSAKAGITLEDFSKAAEGNVEAREKIWAANERQIDQLRLEKYLLQQHRVALTDEQQARLNYLNTVIPQYEAGQLAINNQAKAQEEAGKAAAGYTTKVKELSREEVIFKEAMDKANEATATAEEKLGALKRAIEGIVGAQKTEIEATEDRVRAGDDLNETLEESKEVLGKNNKELDISRGKNKEQREAILRNRDALQSAVGSLRDETLARLANAKTIEEKKKIYADHEAQLAAITGKFGDNNKAAKDIIKVYGEIPHEIKTSFRTEGDIAAEKRAQAIKAAMDAIPKSVKQAWAADNVAKVLGPLRIALEASAEVSSGAQKQAYQRTADRLEANGYAEGGKVRGEGSGKSDSILAYLSDREFVQPTEAVDYYGDDAMEDIRHRRISKEALEDARAPRYADGGKVNVNELNLPAKLNFQTFSFPKASATPTTPGTAPINEAELQKQFLKGGSSPRTGLGTDSWKDIIAFAALSGVPHNVTSAKRAPGALGISFDHHQGGNAVDFASSKGNMEKLASWFMKFSPFLVELIHSPSWYVKNGKRTGAYAAAQHYNHVHVAATGPGLAGARAYKREAKVKDSGGLLDQGRNVIDNLTGQYEGILNPRGLNALGGIAALNALNGGRMAFDTGMSPSSSRMSNVSNTQTTSGDSKVVNQDIDITLIAPEQATARDAVDMLVSKINIALLGGS